VESRAELEGALRRGALINALGVVAKLGFPLLFLVTTWSLGSATTGVFALVFFAGEVLRGLAMGGYVDGVTLVASRDVARAPTVVRVALRSATALAALVALPVVLFADDLGAAFPAYPGLGPALALMGWSLPASAVLDVALAATKARLVMHWQVLVDGLVRPSGLVVAALLARDLHALMLGYLGVHLLAAGLALAALHRCFPLGSILAARGGAPELHRFALPQSLNLTLGRYQSRLDAWILGLFATPPSALAFYATGALLAGTLREVRIVFSTSLAPIAARHHAARDRAALEELLGRLAGWTTALTLPAMLALGLFHRELLVRIDPGYTGDTRFFLVLLVGPVASCALGLAGNLLSHCGHSRWSLANAVGISALNTALSLALVPTLGLLGAALGTAVATATLHVVQAVELRRLEGVRLRLPLRPLVGLALGTLALLGAGAPLAIRVLLFSAVVGVHALLVGVRLPTPVRS